MEVKFKTVTEHYCEYKKIEWDVVSRLGCTPMKTNLTETEFNIAEHDAQLFAEWSCANEMKCVDNLEMAIALWEEFEDIPVDDDDNILCCWRSFEKGTNKIEIWHWFEEFFKVSVAEDLM